jgi:uncharacterized protein with HEPN domain
MDKFADDKVKLFDISRSIDEVQGMLAGASFATFAQETQVKDEVAYQLREIGVAARLLSEEFKSTYGDVDWDVLSNLQFATWDQEIEVDPHALWYIIENDLPRIQDQIYDITTVLEDKEDNFFY